MANNNFVELDFDQILKNLKEFLRQKPEYQDFDFEGAGWSYLLNLLAYNTQYMAFYQNMVANEMFLDSAQLRESAVSLAKLVGYIPRSIRSARAKIRYELIPDVSNAPTSIYIPTSSIFSSRSTSNNGETFDFNVVNSATILPDSTGRFIVDLDLVEGTRNLEEYTVDNTDPEQRFIISNQSMDSSTLKVYVKNSKYDNIVTEYTRSDNIAEISSDSKVYYLIEVEDGKYEVQFGDNVISYKPVTGNVVSLEYIVSSGALANGLKYFAPASDSFIKSPSSSGVRTYKVSLLQAAYGGSDRESLESIRKAAPVSYEVQNRCVTASDYDFILNSNYSEIDSLSVWGGEENVPPIYGSVFISIKPKNGFVLDNAEKETIKNSIIKSKSVLTVQPVIVDPSYTHILIDCAVNYNSVLTKRNQFELQEDVYQFIVNWGQTSFGKFEKPFIYSTFTTMVDSEINSAILNNLTSIQLRNYIYPTLGVRQQHIIEFRNALAVINPQSIIEQKALTTNTFIFKDLTCILANKSLGSNILSCFAMVSGGLLELQEVGSIDYLTGEVVVDNFVPQAWINNVNHIAFTVKPSLNNVVPYRNQILVCEPSDISVRVQPSK